MHKSDNGLQPKVLLLSAQRSHNLGDQAMRDAAGSFVTERFGDNVTVSVFGGQQSDNPDPVPSVLSRQLVRVKIWLLARLLNAKHMKYFGLSSAGIHGPLGWIVRIGILANHACLFALVWAHRNMHLPVPGTAARLGESLRDATVIVTSGGGWLNSVFILTLYENLCVLLTARLVYGIPIYIVGEQVGPLPNRLDRCIVRQVLSRAEIVATRDPESSELAGQLSPANLMLFCDWAYRNNIRRAFDPNEPLRIGVHLRRAHYAPLHESSMNALAMAIDVLHDTTGAIPHLIPTCFEPHESDEGAMRDLQNRCACSGVIQWHAQLDSPEACLAVVASMSINLAVSYHFCLFSLMSGVPCLGIATSEYYVHKLKGLFALFETPEALLRIEGPLLGKSVAAQLVQYADTLRARREQLYNVNQKVARCRHDAGRALVESLSTQLNRPLLRRCDNTTAPAFAANATARTG